MPLSALGLALAAAFLHAFWNLVLARARDVEAATAIVGVVAIMVFAPVAAVVWRVDARVWPYLAASSTLQLAYFALLGGAYRRAELSVVYPISRGIAPVLVLAFGIVALRAATSVAQAGGVALVALGVLLVRGLRPSARSGVVFGLAIACVIAAYTLVDKRGIRFATPIAYLELTLVPPSLVYAAAMLRLKGRAAVRAELAPWTVAAGIATFSAYACVLAALQRASAASVAAVRETSVVIAAALAAAVLKERVGPARLAGAALVVAGIALLSL
jgi:drug/metabolite transporter (DMT)-like permease